MGNSNRLTKQQTIFVQEYIKSCNGIEALKIAYPKSVNWSYNTKHVEVNRLLNNPKINLKIKEHNEAINKKLNESITLNKRKILNEIIELQQKCKQTGNSQNTVNIQALKLLSQIAGMLQENKTEININNNVGVAEVTQFLDL